MHRHIKLLLAITLNSLVLPALPCYAEFSEHKDLTEYRFPEKIGWKHLSRGSDQHALKSSDSVHDLLKGLEFNITTLDVTKKRISTTLIVTHKGEEPLELIVLPCGGEPFPYGGSSPFLVQIDNSDEATRSAIRYIGILYPPAPPPPVKLTIPAKSRTHFVSHLDLTSYEYQGSPEIKLNWYFCVYNGATIKGSFSVMLQAD